LHTKPITIYRFPKNAKKVCDQTVRRDNRVGLPVISTSSGSIAYQAENVPEEASPLPTLSRLPESVADEGEPSQDRAEGVIGRQVRLGHQHGISCGAAWCLP
jgi:hypothetical protein